MKFPYIYMYIYTRIQLVIKFETILNPYYSIELNQDISYYEIIVIFETFWIFCSLNVSKKAALIARLPFSPRRGSAHVA